ncbi:sepiapterin reductase [Episyrphus balteatus]|uniref:sepiapterin reductase n=1 Tax=Episyrphus balteatus TaxID=286459 RepID=UPI002485B4DF|nr:sepiapterin reductase [Episyrphus balteatus]
MDLNQKTIFILTGASKGIGKTLAIECCRLFKPESLAILFARSASGLEETRNEIIAVNSDITVKVFPLDLGEISSEEYHDTLTNALDGVGVNDFERAFIVHNVGSVGDVTKSAKELGDIENWKKYFHLNVFGVCALNTEFMRRFEDIPKLVVNITSKVGIEPFPSMAEYGAGKAAREMYFRVLALEEKDTTVLNYSPGPVDTDMTIIVQEESMSEELREGFRSSREQKTILTTQLTTAKCLAVLKEFKFKSGDHVDYYD